MSLPISTLYGTYVSQLYPIYSDDVIVITLDLGSALVSCNNNDIILLPGYNYNLYHFHTLDQRDLPVYISHINLW